MLPSLNRGDTPFHVPVGEPRTCGHLEVGQGHAIWWEETGPQDGVPVLVLHGGPGGSARPQHRRLFDPERHRLIAFDQRGCGRSTSADRFAHNTTQNLVTDIERLRDARRIDRWVVAGGSWGSTLALAYAEAHPARVRALIVSGVFLARTEDVDWWWEGARIVLPEVFAGRDAWLPASERAHVRRAFLDRILDPDPSISEPAAVVLAQVEAQMLDLYPPTAPEDAGQGSEAVAGMRIFAHYARNAFFLAPDQLLRGAKTLANVPGAIVAGRADLCTPPKGAYDLSCRWSDARLTIVAAAGHRWSDEALARVLVNEISRLTDV